jgi:hypothetical protein
MKPHFPHKSNLLAIPLVCFLLGSCSGTDDKISVDTKSVYPDTLITVDESIFKFKILIDRSDLDPAPAIADLNEGTGDYEIDCGDDFSLRFSEISMSIEEFKSQLENDTSFPVAIRDESPNHLIWQPLLPDSALGYYNLCAMRSINGHPMLIRSTEKFDWSEQNIQKMLTAIQGIE